jgi:hypothetical protein
MIPPLKIYGGGGLNGNEKSPCLVPKISAKTKSPYLHKGVTKMFYINPFRRIKDLKFEIESKDRKIEDLRNVIDRLESPTRPKYHPNVTCTDCEYCIIEEQTHYKGYFCRLNNNCEDYTLKEQVGGVTYVR